MAVSRSTDFPRLFERLSLKTGCTHYIRKCRVLAPCCSNLHSCHICHDENENHELNRFEVTHHVCNNCNEVQLVQQSCQKCGIEFAKYACVICYMFDDNVKGQFHCISCGICRVGGGNNYFHCERCNMCLAKRLFNNHKCVENCSRGGCLLCSENLHTTRAELHVPKCGHLLHKYCYEKLLSTNFKNCPLCQVPY